MKKSKLVIALGLASSVALTGCDSSSSSSEGDGGTSSYKVTAIDGYLDGALVWLDRNRNFILDDNEPRATSGSDGVASLDVTGIVNPEQYPVVVRAIPGQTTDSDNGDVTEGFTMSAPPGEDKVTPLSTLVHVYMEQVIDESSSDEAIESAKQNAIQTVADQLGLDQEDVLGDFFVKGDPDAAYAAENIVKSNALPQTPEDLQRVSEEENDGQFVAVVTVVNHQVKQKIVEVKEATQDGEEPDFDSAESVVIDLNGTDSDSDGVPDTLDDFDDDATEWLDSDGDGTGDNADLNDDTVNGEDDIYPDTVDQYPTDRARAGDLDNDGIDEIDDAYPNDTDNDGYDNDTDLFVNDPTEWADEDSDGLGDNEDDPYLNDSDNDGYDNDTDLFVNDPTEWADEDDDGLGDNEDDPYPNDTDNDSYDNDSDAFDDDPTEWADNDNDGIGDVADNDDDNDSINDGDDNCPNVGNPTQSDVDGNGIGDACEVSELVWDESNWNQANWKQTARFNKGLIGNNYEQR